LADSTLVLESNDLDSSFCRDHNGDRIRSQVWDRVVLSNGRRLYPKLPARTGEHPENIRKSRSKYGQLQKQMAGELKKSYVLGNYRLEPDKQLLSRAGEPIHLPRRPFRVLLYLIEHRDEVVSRQELLDRFWEGKDVYDDALRKCIGTAGDTSS
jgi:DNA-binding response OmpR family regulator